MKHLLYMPLLGLGLHQGHRGRRWLQNRITILKQFVVPSLLAQTNKNFILWISVRPEDKNDKQIKELKTYFETVKEFKTIFTFSGVCFYDDKYPDQQARERLLTALHGSMGEIINAIGGCENVLMTIQPSDDLYFNEAVKGIQRYFENNPSKQAVGFKRGYICNYLIKEVADYNPLTNPPFYTIKFPREIFIDPFRHAEYTAIKQHIYSEKYPIGTPLPSHEFLKDVFGDNYGTFDGRGFLVGTHWSNISTSWNIPYKGISVGQEVLKQFGIFAVPPLKVKLGWRMLYYKLPHWVRRKLRYWFKI
ncbi:MAG: hypothetical protein AAB706_02190 [Patescibacteria group bacterium]